MHIVAFSSTSLLVTRLPNTFLTISSVIRLVTGLDTGLVVWLHVLYFPSSGAPILPAMV